MLFAAVVRGPSRAVLGVRGVDRALCRPARAGAPPVAGDRHLRACGFMSGPDAVSTRVVESVRSLGYYFTAHAGNPAVIQYSYMDVCFWLWSVSDQVGTYLCRGVDAACAHVVVPLMTSAEQYLKHPDPVVVLMLFVVYVGFVLPVFSQQAERLLVKGRTRLVVLTRMYDRRLDDTDTADTDTDAEVG